MKDSSINLEILANEYFAVNEQTHIVEVINANGDPDGDIASQIWIVIVYVSIALDVVY
jgi:hypothetical protein